MIEPALAEQSGFPASLGHVDASHQIAESFGFMPGFVGTLFIAIAVVLLLDPDLRLIPEFAASAAGFGVAGVLLWWYEFRRRVRRTVLVPRNGLVGIYRQGARADIIEPAAVSPYKLHPLNTFKVVGMPVIFGLILFVGIATNTQRPMESDDWGLLGMSAVIFVGCASGIRTRILLKHFYIPKGKWRQEIMLSTADQHRLFDKS